MDIRLQGRYGPGITMPNELSGGKETDNQFKNPVIRQAITPVEPKKHVGWLDDYKEEDNMAEQKYGQEYVDAAAELYNQINPKVTLREIGERLSIPSAGTVHRLITDAKKQGLINNVRATQKQAEDVSEPEKQELVVEEKTDSDDNINLKKVVDKLKAVSDHSEDNFKNKDRKVERVEPVTVDNFTKLKEQRQTEFETAQKHEQLCTAAVEIFGPDAEDIVEFLWRRMGEGA